MLDFQLPYYKELDIRDSNNATWRDIVLACIKNLGKEASLESIYSEIEGHKKCSSNPHWKDKVRQTLQYLATSGKAIHVSKGVWCACTY